MQKCAIIFILFKIEISYSSKLVIEKKVPIYWKTLYELYSTHLNAIVEQMIAWQINNWISGTFFVSLTFRVYVPVVLNLERVDSEDASFKVGIYYSLWI